MSKRYIFIGDIHGCFAELDELLKTISPNRDDVVISLGDFVDRGPDPDLCLQLWIERGYLAVLGNHDKRLIDYSEGKKVPQGEGLSVAVDKVVGKDSLLSFLKTLPYQLIFEEINSVAVHAALDINVKSLMFSEAITKENIFLRGRYVRLVNNQYCYVTLGKETPSDRLWADLYDGDKFVWYGHTPWFDYLPRISKKAIGLDTAVVYGGRLTAALVSSLGETTYVSVRANKCYWKPAGKNNIIVI